MNTIGRIAIRDFKKQYDAIIYFLNVATSNSDSAARISWPGTRVTVTMMIHDVPTIMVSVDNPYHLIDVPMIPTYINCWSNNDETLDALVEKLMGRDTFRGVSPTDPFLGKPHLKY